MVAIVSGSGLGILNTSLKVLGQAGLVGNAQNGNAKENVIVNAANGNLIVREKDDFLAGFGNNDIELSRTYNSMASYSDGHGAGWKIGQAKRLVDMVNSYNMPGSTITRIDSDGSWTIYRYDTTRELYVSTDGDGAYKTIRKMANMQWVWRDEREGAVGQDKNGVYEIYDLANNGGVILSSGDASGEMVSYNYDSNGKLNQVIYTGGQNKVTCNYDSNGNLSYYGLTIVGKSTDWNPVKWIRVYYTYDAQNRLSKVQTDLTPDDNSITDKNVYTTTYTYDGSSNRLATISQSDGSYLGFTYDAQQRVKTITDALNRLTTFEYLSGGKTKVTDPLNKSTTFTYDGKGQLTDLDAPAVNGISQHSHFDYDSNGNVSLVRDPLGLETSYTYDANGNRVLERDAAGNTITRVYDLVTNNLLSETRYLTPDTDGNGSAQASQPLSTRYVYNSKNQLRYVVSPEGRVQEYRYNSRGLRASAINYTANKFALDATEALLNNWSGNVSNRNQIQRLDYVYDLQGQLCTLSSYTSIDANGEGVQDSSYSVQTFVYDQAGQLLKSIDVMNRQTSYGYDGLGRVVSSVDALNRSTITTYDDAKHQTTLKLANGAVTTTVYDLTGAVLSQTMLDANGAVLGKTTNVYDADGRLRQSSDANGNSEYHLYDAAGRKVGDIDRNNYLTEYVYNFDNQLVKTIRYAIAVNVGLIKDFAGKPLDVSIEAVKPASIGVDDRCSWNIYDKAGRLAATVDAGGAVSRFAYDGLSRLISVTQLATLANVATFLNGLPPANFAESATKSGDDRISRTLYDSDGNVLAKLDAEGYLTEYLYDAGGRVVETIAYNTAVASVNRDSGVLSTLRPVVSTKDIHQRYFYNANNQLIATLDGENYLTEIAYDRVGNVASRLRYATVVSNPSAPKLADLGKAITSDDQLTSYTYTALNQLLTETAPDTTITRYSYDVNGKVIESRRALGTEDERATTSVLRDGAGRITNELTAEGADKLKTAVASGAASGDIALIWSSYGVTHAYDQNGRRVSTLDQNNHRTLFYYDANGNLTQTINAEGEVTQQNFNGFNQVTKTTQYAKRIALTDLAKLTGGQLDATLTNLLKAISSNDDRITTTHYNTLGQGDDQVDAMGFHHQSVFNAFGEVTLASLQKTKLDGYIKSTFQYDHRGLKTASTIFDEGTVVQKTAYDAFARVVTQADGNNNAIVIGYDRLGRAISRKAAATAATTLTYDAFDRVLTQTDGIGTGIIRYAYDTAKRSMKVTTSEGVVHTTIKNRHGETVSISDSDGNLTSYAYDKNGKLKSVADNVGVQSSNTYDKAGLTKTTVDANGKVTSFEYDAVNRVATKTFDPNGLNLVTKFTYNAQSQVLTVTDPKNIVNVTEYDQSGRVKKIVQDRDGLKLTTSYEYDSRGNLSGKTDTLGRTSYTNSEEEFLDTTIADSTGANLAEVRRYDKANNLLLLAKGQNKGDTGYLQATRYAYNANNQKIWEVDAEGAVTGYTYDDDNRLIKTTHYANRSSLINGSTKWDAIFIASTIAKSFTPDPAHDVTTRIVYDLDGRVFATIDASGIATVNQRFNAAGQVTIQTSKATPIDVNSLSLTATKADLQALFAKMSYANSERQVTVFDARGNATTILTAVNESGGDDEWQVVQQGFDGNGNLISRTAYSKLFISGAPTKDLDSWLATASNASASDTQQRMIYDAANRLVASATAQSRGVDGKLVWAISSQSYDKNGNVVARRQYANTLSAFDVSTTSINNFIASNASVQDMQTRLRYDGANRLISTAVAQGSTDDVSPQTKWAITSQNYDVRGNVINRTSYASLLTVATLPSDPNALDFNNWIVGVADTARDRTTRFAYDGVNRLAVSMDAAGAVTRYSYDALGNQIKSVLYSTIVQFSGDLTASYTPPSNAADITIRTVFDNKNRPVFQIDGLGYVSEQRYDALGNVVANVRYMTALDLTKLTASPDIAALKALLPTAVDKMQVQRAVFDKAGHQRFTVDAVGAITEYRYDAFGRVQQSLAYQIRHDLSASATLEADLKSYVQTEASSAQVTSYTYDSQNNLLTRTDANKATTTYTYDALGRRLSMKNALGAIWSYSYDAAGHKLTETSPPVISGTNGTNGTITTAFAYDAFGHIIKRSDAAGTLDERNTRYVYDAAGRLAYTIDPLGYVVEQRYNAQGQVIATVQHATALNVNSLSNTITFASIKKTLGADSSADRINRVVYDEVGRVYASIDALGILTVNQEFDAAGRVLSRTTKLGDIGGLPLAANASKADLLALFKPMTFAGSKRQMFSYDANGNATAIFTAVKEPGNSIEDWQVTTQDFDANGNVVVRTRYSSVLNSSTPRANLNDWLKASGTINASNSQERMCYDAANRLVVTATMRNFNGSTSEWSFVRRDYDANGNLVQNRALAKTYIAAVTSNAPFGELDAAKMDVFTTTSANLSGQDALQRLAYDSVNRVVASATLQGTSGTKWAVTSNSYDAVGNLLSSTAYATLIAPTNLPSDANTSSFNSWIQTQAAQNTSSEMDRTTRYAYDAANRVVLQADAVGALTAYRYDSVGNQVQSIAYAIPLANGVALTADLVPTSDAAHDRVSTQFYDLGNRLRYSIDAQGYVTEQRFDNLGRVQRSLRYDSAVSANQTSMSGLASELKNRAANARQTSYVYDKADRVIFVVDADGYITKNEYDGVGNRLRTLQYAEQKANLQISDLTNDLDSKATLSEATARIQKFAYDAAGRVLSITDALGQTETYSYDALGRKLSFANKLNNSTANDRVWKYKYDAASNLIEELSPVVTITVANTVPDTDPSKAVKSVAVSVKTSLSYDAFGQLISRIEANGTANQRTTLFAYDAAGNQIKTTFDAVARYDYSEVNPAANGSAGDALRVELAPEKLTVNVTYDAFGNAIANRDVGGAMSYKAYDRLGHVRYEVDADGYVTGYERDAFGNVTKLTRYANKPNLAGKDASKISDVTNALAQFTALMHANDRSIVNQYDLRGNKISVIEAETYLYDPVAPGGSPYLRAAKTTQMSYDAYGQLTQQAVFGADAQGNVVTRAQRNYFYYDGRGNKKVEITVSSYAGGQAYGYVTAMAYDAVGNLTMRREYANEYFLDSTLLNNRAFDVSPLSKSSSDRETQYVYDKLNQKTEERKIDVKFVESGGEVTRNLSTTYAYDALGNQTAVTDALKQTTYSYYDVLGRVLAVAQARDTALAAKARATQYARDAYGNVVAQYEWANGADIASASKYQHAALPDSANDRITINGYNNAGQVTYKVDAEKHVSYFSYDAYGNVAKQWQTVTVTGTPKIAADLINSQEAVEARAAFKHTALTINHYDRLGRLIQVDQPDVRSANEGAIVPLAMKVNTYNAFGEIVSKRIIDRAVDNVYAKIEYDNAGHIWRTNDGDGVYKINLYDVFGNLTTVLRNTAAEGLGLMDPAIKSASDVVQLKNVLRTDSRYDLLGRVVDSRTYTPQVSILQKDVSNNWAKVALPENLPPSNCVIAVGTVSDLQNGFSMQYRLEGSTTWLNAQTRVRSMGDFLGFDTFGLAAGAYEYQVVMSGPAQASYIRENGNITLSEQFNETREARVAQLFAVITNRRPTAREFSYAMSRFGADRTLGQIAQDIIDFVQYNTPASVSFLSGSGWSVMNSIFANVFNRYNNGDSNYAADIARWATRFDNLADSTKNTNSDTKGAVLADLIEEVRNFRGTDTYKLQAQARLISQSEAFAEDTNSTAARVTELYAILLARPPELSALNNWMRLIANGMSLQQVASAMLADNEVKARLKGNGSSVMATIFSTTLNRNNISGMDAGLPAQIAKWGTRYDQALSADAKGQIILDLISSIRDNTVDEFFAIADQTRFCNAVQATVEYLITYHGSSAKNASAIYSRSSISMSAALEDAKTFGTQDWFRTQIVEQYLILLGRVPDSDGIASWLAAMQSGTSAEEIAKSILSSPEARNPALFPSAPINIYNQNLVNHAFQNALGRAPSADENGYWLGRLQSNLSTSQFVVEFARQLATYMGVDNGRLSDRAIFANKVSATIAYLELGKNEPVEVGKAIVASMTSSASVSKAASEAEQRYKATIAPIRTAGESTPLASLRLQLSRLYVTVFNRAPDYSGFQGFLNQLKIPDMTLATLANTMLNSPESIGDGTLLAVKNVNGSLVALSNEEFVDRVYRISFGNFAVSSGAASERARFVQLLSNGKSRGEVLMSMFDNMLCFGGQTIEEVRGKLQFDAKSAAALSISFDPATNIGVDLRARLAQVKWNDIETALQNTLTSTKAAYGHSYDDGVTLGKAINTDIASADALIAQANILRGIDLPEQRSRMAVMQLYVGLLGRTAAVFSNGPDLAGIAFNIAAAGDGSNPGALATAFLASAEAQQIYPPNMTAAAFVTKVFQTALGNASVVVPDLSTWISKLAVLPPAYTRGEVAWGIINSLSQPKLEIGGIAPEYLQAKIAFMGRVAEACDVVFKAASSAEMAKIGLGAVTDYSFVQWINSGYLFAQSGAYNDLVKAMAGVSGGMDNRLVQIVQIHVALNKTISYSYNSIALEYHSGKSLEAIAEEVIRDGNFSTDNAKFVKTVTENFQRRLPNAVDLMLLDQLNKNSLTRAQVVLQMMANLRQHTEPSTVPLEDQALEIFDRNVAYVLQSSLADMLKYSKGAYDNWLPMLEQSKVDVAQASADLAKPLTVFTYADAANVVGDIRTINAGPNKAAAMRAYVALFSNNATNLHNLAKWAAQSNINDDGGMVQGYLDANGLSAMAPADYLNEIYSRVLRRPVDASGLATWLPLLQKESISYRQLAVTLIGSPEASGLLNSTISYLNNNMQACTAAFEKLDKCRKERDFLQRAVDTSDWLRDADIYDILKEAAPGYAKAEVYDMAVRIYLPFKVVYDKITSFYQGAQLAQANFNYAKAIGVLNNQGSVLADQVRQFTQLFTVLLNRAPKQAELIHLALKLANITKPIEITKALTDITKYLLLGNEATSNLALYPAGMSDVDFINRLYSIALGRAPETDFWVRRLNGSVSGMPQLNRPELVLEFITTIETGGNSDTDTFDAKIRAAFDAEKVELAANGLAPDIKSAVVLAQDEVNIDAMSFDASAIASFNASPVAQRCRQVVQLFYAIFNRSPDADALLYWTGRLAQNGATQASIALELLNSQEGQALFPPTSSEVDIMFVGSLFYQNLGRHATSAEQAQFTGADRGIAVVKIIDAISNAKDSALLTQTTKTLFNGKVNMALVKLGGANGVLQKIVDDLHAIASAKSDDAIAITNGAASNLSGSAISRGSDTITVDRWGNVVSTADLRNANWRTNYTYNFDNQLLTTSRPDDSANNGTVTNYVSGSNAYDALGRLVSSQDGNGIALGKSSKLEYDRSGNVIKEIHADGGVVTSDFDLLGNKKSVKRMVDASTSMQTKYGYDLLGRLTSVESGGLVDVYHANDLHGKGQGDMVATKNAQQISLKETYTYDEMGQRISTSNADDFGNPVTSYTRYDLLGNVVEEIDARRYSSKSYYDAFHHKIKSIDANGNDMTWTVDAFGRVTQHTDLGDQTTYYKYDNAGQLRLQTSTRGQKIERSYLDGRVMQVFDKTLGQITNYTYDLAGNRTSEIMSFAPSPQIRSTRVQNTTLTYDVQNRLSSVKDDVYKLVYHYDKNGNRTQIDTKYTGADGFSTYNTFDAMNRELIVNGDKQGNVVVHGTNGHELAYNYIGNRTSDKYYGVHVTSLTAESEMGETEDKFYYDNAGRLSSIRHDDVFDSEVRHYDALGRLVESGMLTTIDPPRYQKDGGGYEESAFDRTLSKMKLEAERHTYAYNPVGQLMRQKNRNIYSDVLELNDIYYTHDDRFTTPSGYDKAGNLVGYAVVLHGGATQSYVVEFDRFETYQEIKNTVYGPGKENITVSTYNVNGNRDTSALNGVINNQLWYDAEGHVLARNTKENNAFKESFNLVANGMMLGTETQTRTNILGSNFMPADAVSLTAPPQIYRVESAQENLASIARMVWGDSSLWFLIADANGLSADSALSVGQILKIPQRNNSAVDNAQSFQPYNASEYMGSPMSPFAIGPEHMCGKALANLIAAVLSAVVTAYTGQSWLGNVASQFVHIANGDQEDFDWKGLAKSVIMKEASKQVGDFLDRQFANSDTMCSASDFTDSHVAMVETIHATVDQVISVGLNKLLYPQEGFSWRKTIQANLSNGIGNFLGDQVGGFVGGVTNKGTGDFFKEFAGNAIAAKLNSRGNGVNYAAIAADAFGNVLGNSIARGFNSASRPAEKPLPVQNFEPKPIDLSDRLEGIRQPYRVDVAGQPENISELGSDGASYGEKATKYRLSSENGGANSNDPTSENVQQIFINGVRPIWNPSIPLRHSTDKDAIFFSFGQINGNSIYTNGNEDSLTGSFDPTLPRASNLTAKQLGMASERLQFLTNNYDHDGLWHSIKDLFGQASPLLSNDQLSEGNELYKIISGRTEPAAVPLANPAFDNLMLRASNAPSNPNLSRADALKLRSELNDAYRGETDPMKRVNLMSAKLAVATGASHSGAMTPNEIIGDPIMLDTAVLVLGLDGKPTPTQRSFAPRGYTAPAPRSSFRAYEPVITGNWELVDELPAVQGAVSQQQTRLKLTYETSVQEVVSLPKQSNVKALAEPINMAYMPGGREFVGPLSELDLKILFGAARPGTNNIVGGHSPDVMTSPLYAMNPNYVVNPDGTISVKDFKGTIERKDGTIGLSKGKSPNIHTLAPLSWSNADILYVGQVTADAPGIVLRTVGGVTTTVHTRVINGVQWQVTKDDGVVTSSFPTGGRPLKP